MSAKANIDVKFLLQKRIVLISLLFIYLLIGIGIVCTIIEPQWLKEASHKGKKTQMSIKAERAASLMYHKSFKAAIQVYNEIIEEDSAYSNAYGNLAIAYMKLGNFEKASFYFKRHEQIEDNTYFLSLHYTNLAEFYEKQKDNDKAFKACQKALRMPACPFETYMKAGILALKIDSCEFAIQSFRHAINVMDNIAALNKLAYVNALNTYRIEGDSVKVNRIDKMLKDSVFSREIGRFDQISLEKHYKKPTDAGWAYYYLGKAYQTCHRSDSALKYYNAAIANNQGLRPKVAKQKKLMRQPTALD